MASRADNIASNLSLANFSKATELKKRIWFTVGALIVFRFLSFVPLPGVNPLVLQTLYSHTQGGILDIFNTFSGGSLQRMSLTALGVMPYITASIVVQLASSLHPTLAALKKDKSLAPVDRDFAHLLSSWFNRGFLVLRSIDWSTPAIVLEKIIRYEAVHEIRDFPSLRLRIDPPDRRCYGFFHPALPDEPLIFVEVALTDAIPAAIGPLLDEDRKPVPAERAKVAVFYSISNCQKGLGGISFGNFLIKQVVQELRRECPRIETFVTLSPVPGFMRWLQRLDASAISVEDRQLLAKLEAPTWREEAGLPERMRKLIEPLAAAYFLVAKRGDGRPVDAVASFHLGNGARLERLNWLGDTSEKGMRDAAGLMVNYLYDLDDIEKNHEAFANAAEIVAAPAVRKLVRAEAKGRVPEVAGVR